MERFYSRVDNFFCEMSKCEKISFPSWEKRWYFQFKAQEKSFETHLPKNSPWGHGKKKSQRPTKLVSTMTFFPSFFLSRRYSRDGKIITPLFGGATCMEKKVIIPWTNLHWKLSPKERIFLPRIYTWKLLPKSSLSFSTQTVVWSRESRCSPVSRLTPKSSLPACQPDRPARLKKWPPAALPPARPFCQLSHPIMQPNSLKNSGKDFGRVNIARHEKKEKNPDF